MAFCTFRARGVLNWAGSRLVVQGSSEFDMHVSCNLVQSWSICVEFHIIGMQLNPLVLARRMSLVLIVL